MTSPITIVAEAGVNHNGSITLACELIDAAAESGADIVKFQTFSARRQVTTKAQKPEYQIRNTDSIESQYEMLKKLELSVEMHQTLIAHCAKRNVKFLSTGFDTESVQLLANQGQQLFKIPSGEITNLPYLRYLGRLNKEIILSTGMATMEEIGLAIDALEQSGTSRSKMVVLHCTTEYPTPREEVNLLAMRAIADHFEIAVGYSDHTRGIEVATAAAALGAVIIEKHLTLDRSLTGPDHKASTEPSEFKDMVIAIRNIQRALGDGIKRPTASEIKNRLLVRKSIVANKVIRKGEIFSQDNLAAKRPGTGICPMRWDEVIGRPSLRDYDFDELIEL